MLNKQRFAAGSLAALIGVGALVSVPVVLADNGIFNNWNTMYPDSASGDNAGCVLCHNTPSGSGGSFNPYGVEVFIEGIAGAENIDSDGDGCTNLEEIGFSTQPAWTSPLPSYIDPDWIAGDLDPDPSLCGAPDVPDIAVTPLVIDFGAVTLGTNATADVNIANAGSADLTIEGLDFSGSTSNEFSLVSAPNTPFTVTANTSVNVTVDYAPVDESTDNGSLEIASDSPGEGLVAVSLAGTGIPVVVEECVASVDPAIIDFDSVEIGTTETLSTTVTNDGGAECTVDAEVINGGVFVLASASNFTVAPGASAEVDVDYTPAAVGEDAGQLVLNVASPNATITVPLSGSGFEAPVEILDLDIKSFSVTKKVSLARVKPLTIKLTVNNGGVTEGSAPATLTGVQNGDTVHTQILEVTDAVGNGSTRYTLDPFTPTAVGEIQWTMVIADGDPDDDVATATTVVNP